MAGFDTLISILTEHRNVQKKLYSLGLDKKNVLIKNDVQRIGEMSSAESAFIQQLMKVEKQRVKETQRLFEEHENAERGVGLEALLNSASERERTELLCLRDEIIHLAEEQKKINTENKRLLQTHIEFTESMINVVTQTNEAVSHIYSGNGSTGEKTSSVTGLLNREV